MRAVEAVIVLASLNPCYCECSNICKARNVSSPVDTQTVLAAILTLNLTFDLLTSGLVHAWLEPAMDGISTVLLLIAQAIFLSEHRQTTGKVTDRTDSGTYASVTTGIGHAEIWCEKVSYYQKQSDCYMQSG